MSVYAVGDVQGCYEPLRRLLDRVAFDPLRDQLWLAGDLVNRGPDSLGVLRFVASLGTAARVVLGNHDLHLLAVAQGARPLRSGDTLRAVLESADASELIAFLSQQPLLHYDRAVGYCMVHAGIPPHWDLDLAIRRAREAESWLRDHGYGVYGQGSLKSPLELSADLDDESRVRVILSYFTRMRVCTPAGRMDLGFKGEASASPPGHAPWFAHAERKTAGVPIVFGHWAALRGVAPAPNVFALDTGCAWGECLTLMRLADRRRFACSCVE